MKRTVTVMMALVVLALGSMSLTGCETEDNPDTTDNFKGKSWESGPNGMGMWNEWAFSNEGTFQFTHYHNAEHPDNHGTHSYYVENSVLYVTAPDKTKSEYKFTFAGDKKSFKITSTPHTGGDDTYTLVEEHHHE
jgi:hypothetical protein